MVAIFTDSNTSDLFNFNTSTYGLNINYINSKAEFENGAQYNSINEFYQILRENIRITTSMQSIDDFISGFEPVLSLGKDIIYVSISDKLSSLRSSFDAAKNILKDKYPDRRIEFYNTKSLSYGIGTQVYNASLLARMGSDIDSIIAELDNRRDKICVEFTVHNLKALYNSGRVSKTTNIISSALNIKPILKLVNGNIEVTGKVVGRKKSLSALVSNLKSNYDKNDLDNIIIIHSGASDSDINYMIDSIKKITGRNPLVGLAGPSVASHCGLEVIGLVYKEK